MGHVFLFFYSVRTSFGLTQALIRPSSANKLLNTQGPKTGAHNVTVQSVILSPQMLCILLQCART